MSVGGDASMMSTMLEARAAHSACVRRHCAQCKEDVDRVTTHLTDLQNVLEVELTNKVDALQAEKAKMPMGGVAAAVPMIAGQRAPASGLRICMHVGFGHSRYATAVAGTDSSARKLHLYPFGQCLRHGSDVVATG